MSSGCGQAQVLQLKPRSLVLPQLVAIISTHNYTAPPRTPTGQQKSAVLVVVDTVLSHQMKNSSRMIHSILHRIFMLPETPLTPDTHCKRVAQTAPKQTRTYVYLKSTSFNTELALIRGRVEGRLRRGLLTSFC